MKLRPLESKEVSVKDIKFPPSEHEQLKSRSTIVTHRVSDDADRFDKGEYVYAEEIDDNYCFEVVSKKVIKRIEDSPYYKELTAGQISYLRKFDKIAVLTLKKTKYERPYKLSYIKEHYPPKVYEMLKKDKCHCWRARTGIDMIHLEPDDTEQKRTCKNWELLPKYLKDASDDKSIELFGCDNKSHEKMLVIDRIRKYFKNIEYGLRDPKTGKGQGRFNGINTTGKDYDEKWRLGTAEETIKCGCGICFDTVELSRELLEKESNLQFKVYFGYCITEEEDSQAPTHTFLLYKSVYNQEWAWLEGSWGPYMSNDIHSMNPNDLVRMIGIELANASGYEQQIMDVTNCYPKTGSTMREFQHICYHEGKKVMTVNPEKK